jgi:solute carrier family 35 (adenosine 3'-phospho 5'-phosphosulfate transporter), member B2
MPQSQDSAFWGNAFVLASCFIGLQVSYVTWGVIQEFIMTKSYGTGMFPSAVFLVCSNRAIAFLIAFTVVQRRRMAGTLKSSAPLHQFAPASISNVCSSWAQYQALKYVSFPTQTLFKSSKIIPVMLVGKVLHGKHYKLRDYLEALLITAGIFVFMFSSKTPSKKLGGTGEAHLEMVGVAILCIYVLCDSFTSQWQKRVYDRFEVDQFQMMLGVNGFSLLFTGMSLLQTGQGAECLQFLLKNEGALLHVATLSVTSATGQLFIFYTIKRFGPVVFTLIMTTRQMISLVFSCLLYGHQIKLASMSGIFIVFATLFFKARRQLMASRAQTKVDSGTK